MVSDEKLNPREKVILEFLYAEGVPCTIQEIADGTNVSWGAVDYHIEKLKRHGFVLEVKRSKKIMWKFNYEKQEEE